jgi:hypothetical protein
MREPYCARLDKVVVKQFDIFKNNWRLTLLMNVSAVATRSLRLLILIDVYGSKLFRLPAQLFEYRYIMKEVLMN